MPSQRCVKRGAITMPMSKDDIITLIRNIAYEVARTQYGIQDVEEFINNLLSIISYEDPSFNPAQPGDNGHSIGLFQLHDAGRGAGMSVGERSDPAINITKAISYLGPIFADAERQGQAPEKALSRMIAEGQIPADPALGLERALAAKREAERTSWGAYVAGQPWAPTGDGASAQGSQVSLGVWLEQQGKATPYEGYPGMAGDKYYRSLPADEKVKAEAAWMAATGQGAKATTEPREWETPGYQARQAQETEAARLGNVETEIGLGLIPYGLDADTYEWGRQHFADKMEANNWTLKQAESKFNAWMNATAEANRKAEYVTNIKEERAKHTLQTPFFPTTQPGGELDVLSQRYGLPHTPLAGAPLSSFPSPEAAYEQYRNQMGISAQAPEIPTVTAPTVPTPPQGGSAARKWAEEFLRRSGIQIPALGGA